MNTIDFTRRATILGAAALASCGRTATTTAKPKPAAQENDPRFHATETRLGGRLGVAALNTATGDMLTHWAEERFAMCSSFKWLLAAAVLHTQQTGGGLMPDQRVPYTAADILPNSPRTQAQAGRGWMNVDDLCAAAVEVSDNCAANLLLRGVYGPAGLSQFLRASGDKVTRLDRTETALNENAPGDPRDTSTPEAMALTMQRLLVSDDVLTHANRDKLIGWMVACETGHDRLRAGLPPTWRAGDKTGTGGGDHNATNDVAIAWPPGKPPIMIVCYMSDSTADMTARSAAHAEVARIVAETWSA